MVQYAKKSLYDIVEEKIKNAFTEIKAPFKRVVWWDDGGYLRDVIEEICNKKNIGFTSAENNPLSIRAKALNEGNEPRVWYIPEAKKGRDWFRDIKELREDNGSEINCSVEELASLLYEVSSREFIGFYSIEDHNQRSRVAEVIKAHLIKENRPNLYELKGQIITEGQGNPLEYLLKEGWKFDNDRIEQVKNILKEKGLTIINEDDNIDTIVIKVKKWAIAQLLVRSGLKKELLPLEYIDIDKHDRPQLQSSLLRILREEREVKDKLIEEYFKKYWQEVISEIKNPWDLVDCPVEGSLEYKLWENWNRKWEEGQFSWCYNKAKVRYDKLKDKFGYSSDTYQHKISPWVNSWYQVYLMADIAIRIHERVWGEKQSLLEIYTDREKGTWLIDRAIRELIVSGEPENLLPEDHPGKIFLDK
ncbi:MAG: BREX-5 system phosphatase PglZ, partial [Halanaerobiales bacterium]